MQNLRIQTLIIRIKKWDPLHQLKRQLQNQAKILVKISWIGRKPIRKINPNKRRNLKINKRIQKIHS
jgi:hypothetical protein